VKEDKCGYSNNVWIMRTRTIDEYPGVTYNAKIMAVMENYACDYKK
jgi:hypothetical protein